MQAFDRIGLMNCQSHETSISERTVLKIETEVPNSCSHISYSWVLGHHRHNMWMDLISKDAELKQVSKSGWWSEMVVFSRLWRTTLSVKSRGPFSISWHEINIVFRMLARPRKLERKCWVLPRSTLYSKAVCYQLMHSHKLNDSG